MTSGCLAALQGADLGPTPVLLFTSCVSVSKFLALSSFFVG